MRVNSDVIKGSVAAAISVSSGLGAVYTWIKNPQYCLDFHHLFNWKVNPGCVVKSSKTFEDFAREVTQDVAKDSAGFFGRTSKWFTNKSCSIVSKAGSLKGWNPCVSKEVEPDFIKKEEDVKIDSAAEETNHVRSIGMGKVVSTALLTLSFTSGKLALNYARKGVFG